MCEATSGHFKHADLVGWAETVLDGAQNAELVAGIPFKMQNAVYHMFYNAGAGNLAILGDVTNEDDGCSGLFGIADHSLCRRAHLRHSARGAVSGFCPEGSGIESITTIWGGGPEVRVARNVFHAGFSSQLHGCLGKAETGRPHADLINGLLTGNIDHAVSMVGEGGGGLNEQGGFSDARIATKQQHRAFDEAAASDAIQLANTRFDAWSGLVFT